MDDEYFEYDLKVRMPKGNYDVGQRFVFEVTQLGKPSQRRVNTYTDSGRLVRSIGNFQFLYLKRLEDESCIAE